MRAWKILIKNHTSIDTHEKIKKKLLAILTVHICMQYKVTVRDFIQIF